MEPPIFQTLPLLLGGAVVTVLLQVAIILFVTNRRYLRGASVAVVSMVGAVAGATAFPAATWTWFGVGLLLGGLLGYFLRPLGVGLALAFIGGSVSAQLVSVPLVEYMVALDLFAAGLLLTDLAPTLVSTLLASSITLDMIVFAGMTAPAALLVASAFGSARLLGSFLPHWLALRGQQREVYKR